MQYPRRNHNVNHHTSGRLQAFEVPYFTLRAMVALVSELGNELRIYLQKQPLNSVQGVRGGQSLRTTPTHSRPLFGWPRGVRAIMPIRYDNPIPHATELSCNIASSSRSLCLASLVQSRPSRHRSNARLPRCSANIA